MSFRDIAKKALTKVRCSLTGEVPMQELLDRNKVKMAKTKEYEADDHGNKISWSYRFTFDNPSRKRKFLAAVADYPAQEWDDNVEWFDDISNIAVEEGKPEICVEARVLVEPEKARKLRYQFETYVSCEMIIKG
jgi:hypothetical protein